VPLDIHRVHVHQPFEVICIEVLVEDIKLKSHVAAAFLTVTLLSLFTRRYRHARLYACLYPWTVAHVCVEKKSFFTPFEQP